MFQGQCDLGKQNKTKAKKKVTGYIFFADLVTLLDIIRIHCKLATKYNSFLKAVSNYFISVQYS